MSEATAPVARLGYHWFLWNLPISFGIPFVSQLPFIVLDAEHSLSDQRFLAASLILSAYVAAYYTVPIWLAGGALISVLWLAELRTQLLLRIAIAAPLPLIPALSDSAGMARWYVAMVIAFALLARLPRLEKVRNP